MKKRICKIISIVLTVILSVSCVTSLSAIPAYSAQNHETAIYVKAAEMNEKGAGTTIQSALNTARYAATKDNIYKVVVEEGTYTIKKGLKIFSNTTLCLNGVTLKRDSKSRINIICTGETNSSVNKGDTGYDANVNIRIEGGVLDGGATSNTMIKVGHARNFVMDGMRLQNIKNAHMMEVAGVDGFTVHNCTFQKQIMDVGEVGYEAIQLDILQSHHIYGYRSEPLNNRNVLISGCYFENCPRAVGAHTQIYNYPADTITIQNSKFNNIKNVAIHALGWKNCTIKNNTFTSMPRAIEYYSLHSDSMGAYTADTIAKEGETSTTASSKVGTPPVANLVIEDNSISKCGNVKDVYSDDVPLAIGVFGTVMNKAYKKHADDSGGMPKGNYYVDTVSVVRNKVSTDGHGIYLENVRNTEVLRNEIACSKSKYTKYETHGIMLKSSTASNICYNSIDSSPYYGIDLVKTTASRVNANNVMNTSLDGIMIANSSKVKQPITGNYITKAGKSGIYVKKTCTTGEIKDNVIYDCKVGAITRDTKAKTSVGTNQYSVSEIKKLSLGESTAVMGVGEKVSLTESHSPANAYARFSWTSSDNNVVTVTESGVVTAIGEGTATVSVKSSNGVVASCKVEVYPAPTGISVSKTIVTIGAGESIDLNAKIPDGTATHGIHYLSNNTSAVTVNSKGIVTGKGSGTATVAAKTYNGHHACCNIIVKEAPYDIWFDSKNLSMGIGETYSLDVIFPENSTSHSLVFASSDSNVVTISETGEIFAVSQGSATVTATAFNGTVAICNINVMAVPTKLSFANSKYSVKIGETITPETVLPEGMASNAMCFQSSDPDICRIDKKTGEITAKKKGTVTITAKTYNSKTASCTVTVQ